MDEKIREALAKDKTVDIVTRGRKSGQLHRIEIWFWQVDGRTYITGTPGPRDWYANLLENPNFVFHLKESVETELPACARIIIDPAERRTIFSHPALAWYQEQVDSLEELVKGSPLIEAIFRE